MSCSLAGVIEPKKRMCFYTSEIRCGEVNLNPLTHLCCSGVKVPVMEGPTACCGHKAYNKVSHTCCSNRVVRNVAANTKCCGIIPYNGETRLCCDGVIRGKVKDHLCCGRSIYHKKNQKCCENGDVVMSFEKCCDSELDSISGDCVKGPRGPAWASGPSGSSGDL